MSTPLDERTLPPGAGERTMRLAVSPQPQDPMSGPPRAVTFNPTLSLIARQRTRLGGPLKHRHDGAEPSPTNAIVHPSSMSVKPSTNG